MKCPLTPKFQIVVYNVSHRRRHDAALPHHGPHRLWHVAGGR